MKSASARAEHVDTLIGQLAGACAGIGVAELGAIVTGAPGLTDRAAELTLDLVPVPVIEWAIRTLGRWNKPLLRAGAATGLAVGAMAIGTIATSRTRRVVAVGIATAAQLAITSRREQPKWGPQTAVAATATVTHSLVGRRPIGPGAVVGVAAVDVAAAAVAYRRRRSRNPKHPDVVAVVDGAETWPGISALFTPVGELFVTDTTSIAPAIDVARWTLRVEGLVKRKQKLAMGDLEALGTCDLDAALCCIHNRLDTKAVGNIRWTGVPLAALIEHVGQSRNATHMVWRSVDGWSASMPITEATERGGMVALAMNGHPLTPAHGAPARVFIPGLYGQFAGAKWLDSIEFTNGPVADYWTRRGWPALVVEVRPQARIDHPSNDQQIESVVTVTGVAWAPPHGIDAVEVSVDGGGWTRAELASEVSTNAWRRFRCEIQLAPGAHRLAARAIDATGVVQDAVPRPSFPSGVSGHHQVTVSVAEVNAPE